MYSFRALFSASFLKNFWKVLIGTVCTAAHKLWIKYLIKWCILVPVERINIENGKLKKALDWEIISILS